MKTIKNFLITIILAVSFVSLSSCNFFYGSGSDSSYESMFDSLWNDFNQTYALFDVRGVNWDLQYATCRSQIREDMTDLEFFEVLKNLLYPLKDAHVYVKTPLGSLNSGEDNMTIEKFSLEEVCSQYVENPLKCGNNIITYGRMKHDNSIGYIHIAGFASGQTGVNQRQDWASDIDIVLEQLQDTRCMILDVRGNRGGLTGNVTRISGRFCALNLPYAISRTKNGPGIFDYDEGVTLEIQRNGIWQYTKPVYLLTNAQTMSAGEEFTMAMCSQPHVTQIGNHTCGVFSLSLERCMANGWRYSVSVQKVCAMDGSIPEGKGIVPRPENLIINPSAKNDLQMKRALELAN